VSVLKMNVLGSVSTSDSEISISNASNLFLCPEISRESHVAQIYIYDRSAQNLASFHSNSLLNSDENAALQICKCRVR